MNRNATNRMWVLLLCGLILAAPARGTETTLVATGSSWRYLDDGSDQGAGWQAAVFDDSGWAAGTAQLGYGDGDEATTVSFGADANNKFITTYFRRSFSVSGAAAFASATLRLLCDDGAVVYLNGTEAFRTNMPAGTITSATLASSALGAPAESTFVNHSLNPAWLVEGTNVLAVEVHQANATSSDISFDLGLTGSDGLVQAVRGPYLQLGTPSSVVVRWRTDVAADSRVRYGSASGSLTSTIDDPAVTTEHVVPLTGLTADTTYYYSVGTSTETLAGGDADHFFVTSPLVGTPKQTRVWVLGDSGTADANAQAVRDAYDAFNGARYTDLWLMLGDNAYYSGTDAEYQAGVFDMYPKWLRSSVLWPTLGNHDAGSADSATQSGVYYDVFTLPKLGEAGGEPSGTEAYYSFNYGNIHFICLDSQGTDRSSGGAMMLWLNDDLLATTADWIIAFWHHPPYTKGSHDSDAEGQLIEMRQNALPILESYGVDLVLAGHSHSYERSVLLDGHYGDSTTLTGAMIRDGGDGRPDGSGAYHKATRGPAPNEGAVYAVAGSSGMTSGGALNHPVMYISLNTLGSLVLDVTGDTLNATFIDAGGTASDSFSIVKGPTATATDTPTNTPTETRTGTPTGTATPAGTNTRTPIPTPTCVGGVRQGVTFNGAAQSVDGGTWNAPGNQITVALWAKVAALSPEPYPTLLSKWNNTDPSNAVFLLNTGSGLGQARMLIFAQDGTLVSCSSEVRLVSNQWHHVAATLDGSTLRCYVDGVQSGSIGTWPASKTIRQSAHHVRLGGRDDAKYLNGALDDVRIYGRGLSAAEISAIYNGCGGSCANASADLAAWWKLNEGSGTAAADSSGNGRTATLVNGAAWSEAFVCCGSEPTSTPIHTSTPVHTSTPTSPPTPALTPVILPTCAGGALRRGLTFSGAPQSVDGGTWNVTGNQMTVALWAKVTALSPEPYPTLLSQWNNTDPTHAAFVLNTGAGLGQTRMFIFADDGTLVSCRTDTIANLVQNAWHHVAATLDGTTLRCYVDGVQVGTTGAWPAGKTIRQSPHHVRLGGRDDAKYLSGVLDDVRIYDRGLSAGEIASLYNGNSGLCGSGPANLVAWWTLDDGAGLSALDSSGNSHAGTLVNGPAWSDAFVCCP